MRPLRIFYAAGSRPNAALEASAVWDKNLLMSLRDLGHDVVRFDYDLWPHYAHANIALRQDRAFVRRHQAELETALLAQFRAAHASRPVDVFFSYFYSAFVRPQVIRSIGEAGTVTVNWYCNASYQFNLVREIAPAYSYCLVPERFRLDDYREAGAVPILCQEAANPTVYKPYELPYERDVVFIGAAYGDRVSHVRALVDAGVDIRAFGPGWMDLADVQPMTRRVRQGVSRVKRALLRRSARLKPLPTHCLGAPLDDDEMVRMYSRSRVALGFANVGETHRTSAPITQVRLRDFEAPMSGAFYMPQWSSEILEYFADGKEVVCFRDSRDLVAKVGYYLEHAEERESIRTAGLRRALRDHTWQKRLSQAFSDMGLE